MDTRKVERPDDGDYFVSPSSEQFLQGDLFANVPFGLPAPPDAVVVGDDGARFITGPFEAGYAI